MFEKYQEEIVSLRRHLHMHPELSMEEFETSHFAAGYLHKYGIETTPVGECGLAALIGGQNPEGKTIVIRSEMDALPVKECTGLPFASVNEGVMHACGHDAILACGLVLARVCKEHETELKNTVKFLFQPAEENGMGTELMLDAHVMENPKADAFIMYHFANDMEDGMEVQYGPASAAIGEIQLTVHGKGGHWGNPALGIDAIEAAARLVTELKSLNETYSADLPFVVGIGQINGGTAKNIIASQVEMRGTLRACLLSDYHVLRGLVLEVVQRIEAEMDVKVDVFVSDIPVKPIVNDTGLVSLALSCGREIWKENCREVSHHFLSGDSASRYFDYAPGVFLVFTEKKPGEISWPVHNGRFDIAEEHFHKVVEVLFSVIQNFS